MGMKIMNREPEKRALQEFRQDTNIRNIYKKYRKAGQNPLAGGFCPEDQQFLSRFASNCSDVSEVPVDYHQLCENKKRIEAAVDSLPGLVKKRFGNDPQRIIEFVSDPNNREEAIELGLIQPPVEDPPKKVGEKIEPDGNPVE